ncbi:S-layer homology domain-containing protein [Brevibacillus centrosporus]|uniref:S-layer homology domain-containing protein n=1 Tax=Brevibacillus centrosporus TaxID=54910 RepID=A0A1I3ULP2_9BACL|nr:S-layer homology domain-containing protein [Brevibacillus centrosporus]SFJ83842.1 S-layer homology domain-containing protein [Brevibacillus centrosporus]
MKSVFKGFQLGKSTVAAFLSLLLMLTAILPMGMNVASAAVKGGTSGGGLTLTGFKTDEGTDAQPYISYESKITLNGTYGGGINGENLRLRITTNNGKTVEESSARPVLDRNAFTFAFKEISLQPGMNEIDFYENTGNLTKDLLTFYVQYNNTPVLSNLEINNVALLSDPTVIQVYSERNLSLDVTGKAVNADTVKVINKTTGETFQDDVNSSGSFSLDMDARVGYNQLDIVAYNKNKEVWSKSRAIVVTINTGDQGDADQFYNVKLTIGGSTTPFTLVPNQNNSVYGATTITGVKVEGSTMIEQSSGIKPYYQIITPAQPTDPALPAIPKDPTKIEPAPFTDTFVIREAGSTTPIATASPSTTAYKEVVQPQGVSTVFKEYTLAQTAFAGADLENGKTYELVHTYPYVEESKTTPGSYADHKATVAFYKYTFTFYDANAPRLGQVLNVKEGNKPLALGTTVNSIRVTPLDLFVESNMSDTTKLKIYYNGSSTALSSTLDYKITAGTGGFAITLKSVPPGETKVKIVYDDGTNPVIPSVSFVIKPEISPSLELSYLKDGKKQFIDSGIELYGKNDPDFDITVKINNYEWNQSDEDLTVDSDGDGDKTNDYDKVVLISDKETILTGLQNVTTSGFTIPASALQNKLIQGNNTLKFTLATAPNAVFSYKLFYSTDKAPTITNVQLFVEQNKDDIELQKKSTDTAYTTTAFFLSNFAFDIEEATEVSIAKDGKIIAKYELNGSDWDFVANSNTDAKEGLKGLDDLPDMFDDYNFPSTSFDEGDKFEASMDSKEYGKVLNEAEDATNDAEKMEAALKLMPLSLNKGGTTSYEIVASNNNLVTRQKVVINQQTNSWTVLSPVKLDKQQYAMVNSNSVPIRIFAEKATKVMFGKQEAIAYNTNKPDFEYNDDLGKSLPETYYVFEANVTLKPGLNKIKFTVQVGNQTYTDEVQIYNVNTTVGGAESRDILGKKVSFSVFDKGFELKFPSGTTLYAPSVDRQGNDVKVPQTDIFSDVPLYFAMADRTDGHVSVEDNRLEDDMEDLLRLESEFNYASPLYYVDGGNAKAGSVDRDRAPGGRDPYFEGTVNGVDMEPFIDRWEENLVPSKQGTLTIKYDPSIVNAANNIITVFYNNGDEWKNIGGVVNTGKKTIQVPFKGFGYYMVMKTRESFNDVIRHEFARDAIETLYSKGIMNDSPGSGFGTELKITRGEFATMIVKALDLPINAGPYRDNNENDPAEPTFRDVDPSDDDWDYEYKYIETAARAGIVRGKDTRSFYPDDTLTREEAAVIISRALNLKLGTPEASKLSLGKMFTDGQLVDHYATPAVLAIAKGKIMNGEPNDATAKKPTYRFNPKGDLTRAEMAVITIRVMVQLKKLPKQ